MIKKFVERFEANRSQMESFFRKEDRPSYEELVKQVITVLSDEDDYGDTPDPDRIHKIDDGDYQGTLVFVIGATGYQPYNYWYVKVGYGSCSGCDTIQAIYDEGEYDYDTGTRTITDGQVKSYMTLALHVVQNLKKMGDTDTSDIE